MVKRTSANLPLHNLAERSYRKKHRLLKEAFIHLTHMLWSLLSATGWSIALAFCPPGLLS